MTKRSRIYFNRKRADRYRESIFVRFVSFFENLMMAKEAYLELTKPRPPYPAGSPHPSGPAIIGEPIQEITMRPGSIAIIGTGHQAKMLLPDGQIILPAPFPYNLIEKPIADLKKAIDQQIIKELVYGVRPNSYLSPS